MHLEGGSSLQPSDQIHFHISFSSFYHQGACLGPPPWEHPLQCPRQGGDGGDHYHDDDHNEHDDEHLL